MPDQIVLNDEEQVMPVSDARSLSTLIARYVSNALSPIAVSIPFTILVALYHARSIVSALAFAGATLLFMSVGPMLYILAGVRTGKFTDIDVSMRSQRSGPYAFGILSTAIGFVILSFLHEPKDLQTVMLAVIVSGMLLMIITLWWKISMHASTAAGAVTMLAALYGNVVLPAYLLVVLVCWSRVVLHRHTTAQVIAGALISILLAIAALTIRGM
jgi:membrane-associated phospholipid phosphatase